MAAAFVSSQPVSISNNNGFCKSTTTFKSSTTFRLSQLRGRSYSTIVRRNVVQASTANPAPAYPSKPSPETTSPSNKRLILVRLAIFLGMSATYAAYVFLRSTFTYVAPTMVQTLNLSLPQIGQITSAFPLAYGLSRLLTGVVVDRMKPHHTLCAGLLLAGLVNLSMGMTVSISLLSILWALNGLVQGVGAGSSAKMLTSWFPTKQRGLYWALWSTSANVGAFLTPIVCSKLALQSGFRSGLIIPGIACSLFALLMLPLLKSTPSDSGFNVPWEQGSTTTTTKKEESTEANENWKDILINGVLKNRTIWLLAFAYFFVYLVRSGTKSWLHFWLVNSLGLSVSEAANRVSGMEIGGILGTFSAGIVSDMTGGRRVIVTLVYLALVIVALAFTWFVLPVNSAPTIAFAAFSAIGFAINGPQMMIGLIGAEACDRRVVATATGVLGWISYLGAAGAGFPMSLIIKKGGWIAYFASLIVGCVGSIICLSPMWKMKAASSASSKG